MPCNNGSVILRANFRKSDFKKRFSIRNRKFHGPTDFRDINFTCCPEVDGVYLNNDTSWRDVKFSDTTSPRAEHSYRILREILTAKESRQTLGYIHLFEHRSRRRSGKMPIFSQLASILYDYGSAYGFSITRPLISIFLVHILVFIAILMLAGTFSLDSQSILNTYQACLEKLFNPLHMIKVEGLPSEIFSPRATPLDVLIITVINGIATFLQVVFLGFLVQALKQFFSLDEL